ncbi:MAG: hypothetical protein NVSMB68_07060 [Thermoanaerobaculia bacterium]
MTCETFRAQFTPASDDAMLLGHLRSCDPCLNLAIERDEDVMFRALGGSELVPPGGVDAFVDDVMRGVRMRGTESTVSRSVVAWPRSLAVAATVAATIAGSAFIYEHRGPSAQAGPVVLHHQFKTASKPVIENYDSQKATIVEVPSEREDVTVVMVFDDSLPADL